MAVMVRKQVYIEPEQDTALKHQAGKTGMSEAGIIRQAIDYWLQEQTRKLHAQEAWKKAQTLMEARYAQEAVSDEQTWTRSMLHEERLERYDHDPD